MLVTTISTRITKIHTSSLTWIGAAAAWAAASCSGVALAIVTPAGRMQRRNRQHDEHDQRDARHAVGFEAVGRGADRVARVVARAVGDDARVAGIVFIDVEDDFHQVGADIGDFRENAAGDPQRRGAQRFADRETDEARPRIVAAARTAKSPA